MAKTEAKNADWQMSLKNLEDWFELYLVKKAPGIPYKFKEIIVKLAPWLTLIFFVLSLPVILFTLGLGTILAPFTFLAGVKAGMSFGLGLVFTAACLVLEAIAIPGLFKRTIQAWRLVYYAALLGGVQSLFSFNLGGLIIGTGISLYLLFQVKSYYK